MIDARLLALAKQGRHSHYRLASPPVGRMLEGLDGGRGRWTASLPTRAGGAHDDLRMARTCYDHLAGRLGVALADALTAATMLC